jgi:UDP-N-acetylmuramate: L-alanyl-gamma-D-glutamyl-meso-diaminopimelate ligase
VTVYDDFAHHPTAIKTTLEGLRAKVGQAKIIAVIEPRSATMKLGIHKETLSASVNRADQVYWYQNPAIDWDIDAVASDCSVPATATADIDQLLQLVLGAATEESHVVIMSNGGFEGFHGLLTERLAAR